MRFLNILILAFTVCIANSFAVVPVPQSWDFISETGTYSNVGFISTGNFQIAGRAIQSGDAIGAFYASGEDTVCAGYLIWDESNFGIAVWGDDEFSTNVKEGFSSGETIVLKAWDGMAGRTLRVTPTMQFGTLTFQNNAMAIVSSFTTEIPVTQPTLPARWAFNENTGVNANIGLLTTGSFQIGGRTMQQGDAFGAFYLSNGDTLCGGYLKWGYGQNGFIVWGDDEFTASIKEGFSSSESYIFIVWDSIQGKEYKANISIQSGSASFQSNSMTIISAFSTTSQAQSHTIELQQGWNDISSFIVPTQNSMSSIMSGISSNLQLVLDKNQSSFTPPNTGTLTAWTPDKAYHVYMQYASILTVNGTKANPTNYQIQLNEGWNFIPYLKDTELPVTTSLASIIDKVVCLTDNKTYYFPGFGIIDLTIMKPGKGYMIYVSQACTLTYPAN